MNKIIYTLILIFTALGINASPLIFSNDFETPAGSIEFVSDESVLFTQTGDSANFEVVVRDYLGNVVTTGDVQWSLSSSTNLSSSNEQSRTVAINADSFTVETVVLTAYHQEANATGEASIILAEVTNNTKVIPDEDVISGSTPASGVQSEIILNKNALTETIQVGDYVVSGQNTGLLVLADQVTVNTNNVTLLASRASFTQAFRTLNYSGVSQKSSYHAKIYGADNTIEVRDKKNGKLIYQKTLFNSFSCELSGGGPAGINLTGASIDFDYNVTITPVLNLSSSTINEMSLTTTANTAFAFTTGSLAFDSSISGEVDCQVQSLPDFESPPAIIYGLWVNLAVTPSLGVKLQANINGPNATLSGPTGIASVQTEAGVRYTNSNGWEYIDSNQLNYQFDLIDGEFSTDVEFSFSAQAYANANMNVEVSLGKPPLGLELGQFDFMQAEFSETLGFAITTPLDPNDLAYSGPEASLEGRFILTPKAGLSGAVFDALNDVLGIDLSFNQSFSPLIDTSLPHWVSPKPVLITPASTPPNTETTIGVQLQEPDNNVYGSFQLLTDFVPTDTSGFFGNISSGIGSINWIPHPNDEGMIFKFYPRISVDGLSRIMPYANNQPAIMEVGDMLISDVVFADSNMENCVLNQALSQGWVYVSEFVWAFCANSNINDISGIENLSSLDRIFLSGNQISDVFSLASLTHLTYLDLEYNQINNVSALRNFTQLRTLKLSNNQISDVSALEELALTELTELSLSYNQISNVTALGSLTQLTRLGLSNNQISNVTALGSLTQLTVLSLSSNQISDVSALGSLTQLTSLALSNNQISDVSALGSLTQLTYLSLFSNQISDVSALDSLTQLITLYLHSNNYLIPCSQLEQFFYVLNFEYDDYYDVDGDGMIILPTNNPPGVDEACGTF
ncbi:hypothetical protein GCM10011365_25730 [Marinicella pacifica]|uniref:Leucine-rich repeat domain-containing protein n=1 Tax=Marinicella pacifica TaxID=1171543 RepID=A0A917FTE9_9GAMM|nr:leucine-rich repeat domain-containing protein [Marinicella pacifica]GGG03441.1 hypothetical protein GCM10011365_25730 [Marinicella pacifica]